MVTFLGLLRSYKKLFPFLCILLVLLIVSLVGICFVVFHEGQSVANYHEFLSQARAIELSFKQGYTDFRIVLQSGKSVHFYAPAGSHLEHSVLQEAGTLNIPLLLPSSFEIFRRGILFTLYWFLMISVALFGFTVSLLVFAWAISQALFHRKTGEAKAKDEYIPPKARLDDVAGATDVKRHFREVLQYYVRRAALPPGTLYDLDGVLLSGPSGSGKTALVRGFAGELGVPVLSRNGGDFEGGMSASSASLVADVFNEAKLLARRFGGCLIFIEEIDDYIARGISTTTNPVLTALKTQLSGFNTEEYQGILVVVATNLTVQDIVPELTRKRRLGTHFYVGPLDDAGRKEAVHIFAGKSAFTEPLLLAAEVISLVDRTRGLVGADMEAIFHCASNQLKLTDIPPSTETAQGALELALQEVTQVKRNRVPGFVQTEGY